MGPGPGGRGLFREGVTDTEADLHGGRGAGRGWEVTRANEDVGSPRPHGLISSEPAPPGDVGEQRGDDEGQSPGT